MQKIYVIDSNVPLHDPQSIQKFQEHIVIIPQIVLQEVDNKKREIGELGYNSRSFSRFMDSLRIKGNLTEGVKLNDKGGMLYVQLYTDEISSLIKYQDMCIPDNRIISTAKYIQQRNPDKEVILVSKDLNIRLIADCYSIKCEDYKNTKVQSDELYTGIQHIDVCQDDIDRVYDQGKLDLNEMEIKEPYPNECFVLHSTSNTKHSALVRYNAVMKELRLLPQDMKTCDILPKNVEQTFLLDILKDDDIKLISVNGKVGSGKTFITLVGALYNVLEMQRYKKIILLKPIISMDNSNELGFLPGSLEDKLSPWMQSYGDNLDQIMEAYIKEEEPGKKRKSKKEFDVYNEKSQGKTNPMQELVACGLLEFGSLEHARGRSWKGVLVICDEIQNVGLNGIKSLITRIGENSKIILMGCENQIDNPYLDSKSNSLSIISDAFKGENIAAHITLKKTERSKLAEIASDILDKK